MKIKLIQGKTKEFRIPFIISLVYTSVISLINLTNFDKFGIGYSILITFSTFYFTVQFSSWMISQKYPILHSIYGGGKITGWVYAVAYFSAILVLTYITLFGV